MEQAIRPITEHSLKCVRNQTNGLLQNPLFVIIDKILSAFFFNLP